MMQAKNGNFRRLVLAAAVAALAGGVFAAAPARADEGWHDHDGWRAREWREHEWREHERREHAWRAYRPYAYVVPGYVAPGYVYAPPPVVYAPPPPVVYAPAPVTAGINVVVPLHFR